MKWNSLELDHNRIASYSQRIRIRCDAHAQTVHTLQHNVYTLTARTYRAIFLKMCYVNELARLPLSLCKYETISHLSTTKKIVLFYANFGADIVIVDAPYKNYPFDSSWARQFQINVQHFEKTGKILLTVNNLIFRTLFIGQTRGKKAQTIRFVVTKF